MSFKVYIPETVVRVRLDKVLGDLCADLSRSRLKSLIQEGYVRSTHQALTDPGQKISGPIDINISLPEAVQAEPLAEQIPLDVVYEDSDLLVINKSAGLVVHPAAGHHTGTLVNALLYHCGNSLSGIGGVKRPGIVHRLDKETSGLMVVAKNDAAHQGLSEQFADRSLSRSYTAYTWGLTETEGTVESYIARSQANRKKMAMYTDRGKLAITHYHRVAIYGTLASKVICELETGRTHQIRLHLASLGNGIINDSLYGAAKRGLSPQVREEVKSFSCSLDRQALHAHSLRFVHPRSGASMQFQADLPEDLKRLENILQGCSLPAIKNH